MTVEAVDEYAPSPLVDPRLVVGIGRPYVGAHLENLGFPERRMKRVSRAQHLDRRTHADSALFRALDHRRADHEFALRPRDDIKGKARMQEPDRAGEGDLARAHPDHLAAHAAQFLELGPRRKAPAIDDEPRLRPEPLAVLAKAHLGAAAAERAGERAHRAARIKMALASEEETGAKTSAEIGFERGDPRLIRPLMPARAPGEAVDLADIARRRDDQRASARDSGDARVPPVDRAFAQIDHALRRAFALAERRQHAACKPRRVAAKFARSLDERHPGA